ncbi:GNAT family N-acetyltransferase [Bythopirellula polymerisocia]|uniref:BioF2-like acetyltransferase domain-containing protein n=1 Tax=Bythopirellula polymerisocia TaxID=2528003 RepID=A0A5C6CJP7_9BACT|nr:GNAT family N-acetyltransferase [Bythopirellula polymerisocia]TWU24582.1 hypothetical protein Pla144_34670 [Bythopirellula polymerisocia]
MGHIDVIEKAFGTQPLINVVAHNELRTRLSYWQEFLARQGAGPLNRDPSWLLILAEGRGHVPYCLEAIYGGQVRGILPLALVAGPLFGRFLVSLPHVSSGGVCADNPATALDLVDQAIALADDLNVDFLELRHQRLIPHAQLEHVVTDKAHMLMELPADEGLLWDQVGTKVRNQVRKAEKLSFRGTWGGVEILDEFYTIYTRRMRDFGTPTDSMVLFERILACFPQRAELIVVRQLDRPVAAAMVLHGQGFSEIHRSASLTELRSTGVNTWLHWQALLRAQQRGNRLFDFGRPTVGSSVYTFKKRFGAKPQPAAVQHYLRRGSPEALRRAGGKFNLPIKLWGCLPVYATRWLGPWITRGMP